MPRIRRSVRAVLLVLALALAFIGGQLTAAQPQMQSALRNLKEARANLNKATSDKGGHRNRALSLVNDAIDEVEKGIAYDRRH